jgi:hypothetical protein
MNFNFNQARGFGWVSGLMALSACNLADLQRLANSNLEVTLQNAPSLGADPVHSEAISDEARAYLGMDDQEIFIRLQNGGIGKCFIATSAPGSSNYCQYYLKSKIVKWPGKGWPLNPMSKDSTGCISQYQYGGYSPDMATPDLIHNGAAQARDALLSPQNPCGLQGQAGAPQPVAPLPVATQPVAPPAPPPVLNPVHGPDQDPIFSPAPAELACPAEYLGHRYHDSYMDFPNNRKVCDYSGSVTDQQCASSGSLLTEGSHGKWCQQFAHMGPDLLLSLARMNPVIAPPATSAPKPAPIPSVPAGTSPEIAKLVLLSDAELFKLLLKNGVGECFISDDAYFCQYYFKSKLVPWAGKGWPMNPESMDSTGCISPHQWGGYSSSMATSDLIHNGAEQARDAFLSPQDPCGLKGRSQTL